ncbi:MAG: alpha,alpha-trehalase, partial [Anaerolineaceae bacterium]|nr:alpha,alpha-trehalase [Anaerolineaceae bacterium]
MNISDLETPSLAAFLYREGQSLLKIAGQTNARTGISWLQDKIIRLQELLEECWDEKSGNYQYRDMQSHRSPTGATIKAFMGSGTFQTKITLAHPSRLVIHLELEDENTRRINLKICGIGETGSVSEEIKVRDFIWSSYFAQYTTNNLFIKISNIEISGLHEQDHCQIKTADYTQKDITQLMPLWAGMISKERAKLLVESTIKDQYLEPFGIPVCPQLNNPSSHPTSAHVHIPWNHLVGEGLINYNYYNLAADLVTRLMKGYINYLKKSEAFREMIHCKNGKPSGTRNHLRGLAPLGLFITVLGVQYIKDDKIIL